MKEPFSTREWAGMLAASGWDAVLPLVPFGMDCSFPVFLSLAVHSLSASTTSERERRQQHRRNHPIHRGWSAGISSLWSDHSRVYSGSFWDSQPLALQPRFSLRQSGVVHRLRARNAWDWIGGVPLPSDGPTSSQQNRGGADRPAAGFLDPNVDPNDLDGDL